MPSFIVLDQPSQAFFPRDRERGGDSTQLTDTDRENTRQLYQLTHEVVAQMTGALQVIALDHADFEDPWFAESVVETRGAAETRSSHRTGVAATTSQTPPRPRTTRRPVRLSEAQRARKARLSATGWQTIVAEAGDLLSLAQASSQARTTAQRTQATPGAAPRPSSGEAG